MAGVQELLQWAAVGRHLLPATLLTDLSLVWVSDCGGRVAGVAGVAGVSGMAGVDLELSLLAVQPACWGRGLAGRLLDRLEQGAGQVLVCLDADQEAVAAWLCRRGYRPGPALHSWQKEVAEVELADLQEEDLQEAMTLVNNAYKVELGTTGISFKSSNRFCGLSEAREAGLKGARLAGRPGLVGVVGLQLVAGVAELGPLAVHHELTGRGLGTAILREVERRHPLTAVGVVSCRKAYDRPSLVIMTICLQDGPVPVLHQARLSTGVQRAVRGEILP